MFDLGYTDYDTESLPRLGRDADGSFRLTDFNSVVPLVNARPTKGILKTGKHCRDRYYHLKDWYGAIKDLLNSSGFGWDAENSITTAEDYVWEKYLEVRANVYMFQRDLINPRLLRGRLSPDTVADV